jgi:5-methylcytosine-specific restriction endonuclease McrA
MVEPVLVLNANFEPINVCNTRRAIGLVLSGKASMVLNGRGEIKTVSRTFPRPSIIRLDRMVKRPRPRVRLTKREILRRDDYTCQYCGGRMTYLTIDHIVPRRLGGRHSWDNLVAACPNCNHRRLKCPCCARRQNRRPPLITFLPATWAITLSGCHLSRGGN